MKIKKYVINVCDGCINHSHVTCDSSGCLFKGTEPPMMLLPNIVPEYELLIKGDVSKAYDCGAIDGMKDGIRRFAWWKDGVQYVGTTGKTLADALSEIK